MLQQGTTCIVLHTHFLVEWWKYFRLMQTSRQGNSITYRISAEEVSGGQLRLRATFCNQDEDPLGTEDLYFTVPHRRWHWKFVPDSLDAILQHQETKCLHCRRLYEDTRTRGVTAEDLMSEDATSWMKRVCEACGSFVGWQCGACIYKLRAKGRFLNYRCANPFCLPPPANFPPKD